MVIERPNLLKLSFLVILVANIASAFVSHAFVGNIPVGVVQTPKLSYFRNENVFRLGVSEVADVPNPPSLDEDELNACPRGYFLDSVRRQCRRLGPLGRVSQLVESSWAPMQKASRKISTLFGIDTSKLSEMGVGFALAYAVLSTLNGALSLSCAWYISCRRTGLSPLHPGQWKTLVSSYATIYALIQLLRPFRVAAAVAMSKLTREFLDTTQQKLNCSLGVAVAIQYTLGWVAWAALVAVGVSLASLNTGVPILGGRF